MQITVVEILFQDSLYDSGTFFFFFNRFKLFLSFRCYIRGSYLRSFQVFLFEWSLATLNRDNKTLRLCSFSIFDY